MSTKASINGDVIRTVPHGGPVFQIHFQKEIHTHRRKCKIHEEIYTQVYA
jgi:hypothetical protein